MLQPTRTKYRKAHKGRIHGNASRCNFLNYGAYGLKAIQPERVISKQIVMKRFRARAKGRASPIMKPYSNLTIILSEKMKEEKHGTKG